MVGQNIGKYRVVDRIGRGGMGTVYRATDETLHREVAIKVLNAELNDPVVARRFRAEAVTVARLNHPGIATIFELFQHEGQWLMVMEFVRGETLESLVLRKGPLSVEEAAPLAMQALNALAHAHSLGVVHRDLKPANIMINEAGVVKVMDFGIARVSGTEHLTSAGFLMGTPAYMAPEQVTGGEIDARADLYSMACVLYHLLTGKLPFKGDTPFALAQSRIKDAPIPVRELRAELPAWVGQVLDLALARTPEQRIQSAALFHEALRRGLANLPLDTPAPGSIPPELIATAVPGALPTITPAGFTPPVVRGTTPASTPASGGSATDLPVFHPTPMPFHGSSGAFSAPSPSQIVQVPLASAGAATPAVTPTSTPPPPVSTPVQGVPLADRRADPAYESAAVTMVSMPTPVMTPGPPKVAAESAPAPAPMPGPPAASTAPLPAPTSTPGRGGLLVAAGAVLLLGGGGLFMWLRPRAVPPPPPAASMATPAPTVEPPVPPAEPPSSTPAVAAALPAPTTPPVTPPVGTAGGSAIVPGTTPARGRGRATATPARATDPIVAYGEVRAMLVSGKKAEEQDVVLSFVAGQISLVAKKGGANLGTMAYADLKKAIYTRAKNPRWDAGLAAPPADVDMPGGLFRSARHWLALQSPTSYFILRLNDADYRAVMTTVTERTGMTIEQTPAGGL